MANKTWEKEQKAFQSSIKELREKAGLTQVELAQVLRKPQSFVSKYENGERRLDYVEIKAICHALDADILKFDRLYVERLLLS